MKRLSGIKPNQLTERPESAPIWQKIAKLIQLQRPNLKRKTSRLIPHPTAQHDLLPQPLYEIVRLKGAPIPAESVQDLANHVKITYDTLKDSHHLRSENLAVLKKLYECFETQGLYRGLTPRATTIPKDIASKLSPLISNIFEAYSDILIKRKLDGSLDPEQRRLASL